jgi:hypothetical protein
VAIRCVDKDSGRWPFSILDGVSAGPNSPHPFFPDEQVRIDSTWVSMPGGYAPAVVTRMSPAVLPVEGGLVTVDGINFGASPCGDGWRRSMVLLRVTVPPSPTSSVTFSAATRTWGPASALTASEVECAVEQWEPSAVVCRAPPGLDASVAVRVVVGGQATTVGLPLGYAAPSVTAVAAAGPVGTPGGALVTVTGTGFPQPPWPVAVVMGGALCDVVNAPRATSTALTCVAPRGLGLALLSVHSPLQSSNGTAAVAYAPPTIIDVSTPQGRALDGGFPIFVRGSVRDAPGAEG